MLDDAGAADPGESGGVDGGDAADPSLNGREGTASRLMS